MSEKLLPVLPEPLRAYGKRLAEINGLDCRAWCFFRAMLFGADRQWWGDGGRRPRPHEGIDLVLYKNSREERVWVTESLQVPVAVSGRVAAVVEDFLGWSVFVHHESLDVEGRALFTLYGHLLPAAGIIPGRELTAGEILGSLAAIEKPVPRLSPHLHFSVAYLPPELLREELCWECISCREDVIFLDPADTMDDIVILAVLRRDLDDS